MDYDAENDLFICQNGKTLKVDVIKFKKSKTGYESEKTFMHVGIVVIVALRVNILKEIILKFHWKKELRNLKLQKSLIAKEKKIQKELLLMKAYYLESIEVFKQKDLLHK